MGIPIFRLLVFMFILSSCSALKQERELYKDVAFCTCLNNNMRKVDSAYSIRSTDVSSSMILMNESINPDIFQEVISYTDSVTSTVYQYTSHTTSQAGERAHFISLSCLEYYRSDYLKNFINVRMKVHK